MEQAEHPMRIWRESQGLSQADLGEKLRVGATMISQIERRVRGCSLALALDIRVLAGDAVPLESLTGPLREAAE